MVRFFLLLILLLNTGFACADDFEQGDSRWLYRYIDHLTGGETFETYSWGDTWYLTHLVSGLEMIRVQEDQSDVFLPQRNLILGDGVVGTRLSTASNGDFTLTAKGNLNLHANGVNYRWPTADGSSGQFIRTDGSGVLSFATGGGNSFETITPPAGTTPVADSSTDTLTITESPGVDITGTASTDTLNFAPNLTELNSVTLGDNSSAIVTLGFNPSGTGGSIVADATDLTFSGFTDVVASGNLIAIESSAPTLQLTDTTAGDDDFEFWVNADILGVANRTTGNQIWRTTAQNGFNTIGLLTTEGGADLNGAINASSASSFILPSANLTILGVSDGESIQRNGSSYLSAPLPLSTVEGRLTLTSATAITSSDVTAATTVYFTPYRGDRISLYDGTRWRAYSFSERSVGVPATTVTPFDVFMYDNSGTLSLETTNWTNDTTRATALVLQNGVQVRSGAATRRYLGTCRTTSVSGQTEDSALNRFVANAYNPVQRRLADSGATQLNLTADDAWKTLTNDVQVSYVQIGSVPIILIASGVVRHDDANKDLFLGIAFDAADPATADSLQFANSGALVHFPATVPSTDLGADRFRQARIKVKGQSGGANATFDVIGASAMNGFVMG